MAPARIERLRFFMSSSCVAAEVPGWRRATPVITSLRKGKFQFGYHVARPWRIPVRPARAEIGGAAASLNQQ